MNHTQILKRAWSILWSYRALWIFGAILALTSPPRGNNSGSSGRGSGNGSNNGSIIDWPTDIKLELERLITKFNEWLNPETQHTLIIIGVAVLLIFLLLGIVFTIGRFVSQTALIRMVDRYENSGEKVSWRKGFSLGWNRAAWRLFLVNLVVYLPLVLVFITLFACAFLPLLLGSFSIAVLTWTGVVGAIGLVFLVIFMIFLVAVALSLVMEMIYRVVVLEKTGVMDGIRLGLKLVRNNLKDVFVMWLILVGVQLGFMLLILPVVLLLGTVGLLIGGGGGVGIYFLIYALADTTAGWVSGAIVGVILFIVILALPLTFLGGLLQTYISTVWTLAYRSLTSPVAVLPEAGIEESPALPE